MVSGKGKEMLGWTLSRERYLDVQIYLDSSWTITREHRDQLEDILDNAKLGTLTFIVDSTLSTSTPSKRTRDVTLNRGTYVVLEMLKAMERKVSTWVLDKLGSFHLSLDDMSYVVLESAEWWGPIQDFSPLFHPKQQLHCELLRLSWNTIWSWWWKSPESRRLTPNHSTWPAIPGNHGQYSHLPLCWRSYSMLGCEMGHVLYSRRCLGEWERW